MIDRTTGWAEAAAIPNATSDAVLQALVSTWMLCFGIPKAVTTDKGGAVHLSGVDQQAIQVRNLCLYNYGVPPAGEWSRRTVSPFV